ncbi:alpha/beta-hydrolase [Hypoxylon cercidicola]|nr:alpha/beta-hydrolase [Hypoxylon cercidicola]
MHVQHKVVVFFIASNLLPQIQAFEWEFCPTTVAPENSPLRCVNITVHLDWDSPEKGNITIGVAKLPARNQDERIGNIFYQPGGPGHPGSDALAGMASGERQVGTEILDHFDMIGVDPRGTGLSNPVKCDVDMYNTRLTYYPSNPDSFEERVRANLAFRKSCIDMTGSNLIDYMDLISIAKDYEQVRIVLGGEPMNWLGVSYGTQLGSQYAELFPNNIRSMVLDSVVSQSQSQISMLLAGAAGLNTSFRKFARWCEAQNTTVCPALRDSKNRSVIKMFTDITAQAEKQPLPCKSAGCLRPNLTADEIRMGTALFLYTPSRDWPRLGEAIYNTTTQSDAGSLVQYQTYPAANSSAYVNSAPFAAIAIACQDWTHHDNMAEDIRLKEVLTTSEAPLMKGLSNAYQFQLGCIGWPANIRNPPHPISIPRTEKLPKILITEAIYDPATPFTWGMQLREEIGKDRVVLVTKKGGGHPCYEQPNATGGKTKTAIEQYIFNLTLPEDGVIFDS